MMASASDELAEAIKIASLEDKATAERERRNPAFSQPTKRNHRVTDITEKFSEACSALQTAQLVKDDSFTLFESVQALEIMDPKMDSGFLAPGETHEYTFDVSQRIRMEAALGIMDKILGYWVAWHQGWPLAQNVLTCLYIDNLLTQKREPGKLPVFEYEPLSFDPESRYLITKIIWAFCIGIIKLIQAELELVQSHLYYEEEDLNTHTFQLDLLSEISDVHVVSVMHDTGMKLLRQKFGNEMLRLALNVRLSFVFSALSMYGMPDLDLDSFEKVLDKKWNHYRDIEATHHLAAEDVGFAFSSKVQRRLGSTAPPRPIVDLTFETVHQHMLMAFERDKQVIKFADIVKGVEMQHITHWIMRWAMQPKPPPAVSRAILQSTLFDEGGAADMPAGITNLVIADLQKHVVVHELFDEAHWDAEMPLAESFLIARRVESYLNRVTPLYQNMVRALCQNPCRVRRCLSNIQTEFGEVIDALNEDFFGGELSRNMQDILVGSAAQYQRMIDRVKFWRRTVQTWIIGLGFKLELYLPHELAGIYSLLAKLLHESQKDLSKWVGEAHYSHKSFPVGSVFESPNRAPKCRELAVQSYYINILWGISDALSLIFSALTRLDSRLGAPQMEFGELDFQVEARLKPFLGADLNNPEVRKEEIDWFKIPWTDHEAPTKALFHLAAERLADAKPLMSNILKTPKDIEMLFGKHNLIESKTFLLANFKSLVAASVLVGSLEKGLQKYDYDEAKLAAALHIEMPESADLADSWFVVPKVTIK